MQCLWKLHPPFIQKWRLLFKILWETNLRTAGVFFKIIRKFRGLAFSDFKTHIKSIIIKTTWLWHLCMHKDQWNRTEIPESSYLIINRGVRTIPKGRNNLSANNSGRTGGLHAEEWMWAPISHHIQNPSSHS